MAEGVPNWSSELEDLLDEGKKQEAQQLLEGLVGELQSRPDAATSLSLASAISDLASLYQTVGLSSQADSAASAALLIKHSAQCLPTPYPRTMHSLISDYDHTSNEGASAPTVEQAREVLSRSDSSREEEWEALLCEGLMTLDGLSPAKRTPESLPNEKKTCKQRGRGAFTRGEMGMYSDRLSMNPIDGNQQKDMLTEESESAEDIDFSNVHSKVTCGVKHVLVVSFPSTVVTKDLENLFEPFASHGVAIRWVNDTTALAVFRNPQIAEEALLSTKKPPFKVEHLMDGSGLVGLVNERDLQPPVPRPATSSQVAHRMIMGALRRQGIHKNTASTSSFQSSQKQESERKQRLHTRQKLRDEAWGSDG